MRPTPRGILFLAVALLLYLLARQTTIGWFYVVDAGMWAAALVNLFLPGWTLRRLKARRALDRRASALKLGIFEGDAVTVSVTVTNGGRLPRFLVALVERCPLLLPGQRQRRFLLGRLGGHSSGTATYQVVCGTRGDYRFGPLLANSASPFGLFRAQMALEAPLRVLVFPQVLDFDAHRAMGEVAGLSSPVVFARSTGDFRSAREYYHGDSLRHVHWRSSARQGKLMVKQFDAPPQPHLGVLFDARKSFGEGKEATLEYAVKLAAALGCACLREGGGFFMAPPGPSVRFSGPRPLLEYLARLQTGTGKGLVGALRSWQAPGAVVAIVAAADAEGVEALVRQAPRNLMAVVLLQGFAAAGEAPDALPRLRRLGSAGIALVTCTPGALRETLDALARSRLLGGRVPAGGTPGRARAGEMMR